MEEITVYKTHKILPFGKQVSIDCQNSRLHKNIYPTIEKAIEQIEFFINLDTEDAYFQNMQYDKEKEAEQKEAAFFEQYIALPDCKLTSGKIIKMVDKYCLRSFLPKAIGKEERTVSAVKWNRRKYNNMEHREQAEYEKRCNETKQEYLLILPENKCLVINKTLYNALKLPEVKD